VDLLADENIPRLVVQWLRHEGHDVLYAAEDRVQAPDIDLWNEAEARGFVIHTEDLDFGELVFRERLNSHGVILMRMETHLPLFACHGCRKPGPRSKRIFPASSSF
jgi:predicted nuclease of predicted toxin-antitoxin system